MVSGDDEDADARGVAAGDRAGHLRARRVEHRDQAGEAELALGVVAQVRKGGPGGQRTLGEGQDPQALGGAAVDLLADPSSLAVVELRFGTVRPEQGRAAGQQRLRRALGVYDQPVALSVDRRHQLAIRVEVELPAAAGLALGHPDRGAELSCGAQDGDLGGVSAGFSARLDARVVAGRGNSAHSSQRRIVPALDLGSLIPELHRPCRRPDQGRLHPVLGQSAGLVGADHVGRAERLHRAEPLDDGAAAGQGADGDGQRQGDHRQQPLGDKSRHEPNREDDGVDQRQPGREGRERDEDDPECHRHRGDQPGDPPHLDLERAGVLGHALRERRYPPQLGGHAGGEDNSLDFATGAAGAAEDQIAGRQQGHVDV